MFRHRPPTLNHPAFALLAALLLLAPVSVTVARSDEAGDADKSTVWTFTRDLSDVPRGGTTRGPKVERDTSVSTGWKALKKSGLSDQKRDRRAILALQGEFKVEFEFIETFAIDPATELDQPYYSWATEYVAAVEKRNGFISLQHLMVMSYIDPKSGKLDGPHVMKHWRQDWTWQPSRMWEYQGENTWASKPLEPQASDGRWLWEIYQVDDSPRYAGLGKWQHFDSVSTFSTDYMARPLPRREQSVRDDYAVLSGEDMLILTPTAWYHEQRNFKQTGRQTAEQAKSNPMQPGAFLSREIGHNSYERVKDVDFTAGHRYWAETSDYWRDVRIVWREIFADRPEFSMKNTVDGKPLFAMHFEQAQNPEVIASTQKERRQLIRKTIQAYLI